MPHASADNNGVHEPTIDEEIALRIQAQLDDLDATRARLQDQIDEIAPSIRRYEKALLALRGEPLRKDRRDDNGEIVRPKLGRPAKTAGKTRGVGDALLGRAETAFRKLAAEHDDVTQTDVRSVIGISSSQSALAFAELRSQGVIRLARQDGNRKLYRLTREALNAQTDATLLDETPA